MNIIEFNNSTNLVYHKNITNNDYLLIYDSISDFLILCIFLILISIILLIVFCINIHDRYIQIRRNKQNNQTLAIKPNVSSDL